MRYIFEIGPYPKETVIDEKDFPTDAAAIEHAKTIGADYVWDCPESMNPGSIYRRPGSGKHVVGLS